jgi:hypothetical protein
MAARIPEEFKLRFTIARGDEKQPRLSRNGGSLRRDEKSRLERSVASIREPRLKYKEFFFLRNKD